MGEGSEVGRGYVQRDVSQLACRFEPLGARVPSEPLSAATFKVILQTEISVPLWRDEIGRPLGGTGDDERALSMVPVAVLRCLLLGPWGGECTDKQLQGIPKGGETSLGVTPMSLAPPTGTKLCCCLLRGKLGERGQTRVSPCAMLSCTTDIYSKRIHSSLLSLVVYLATKTGFRIRSRPRREEGRGRKRNRARGVDKC